MLLITRMYNVCRTSGSSIAVITGCFQEESKDSPISAIAQQSLTSRVLLFLFCLQTVPVFEAHSLAYVTLILTFFIIIIIIMIMIIIIIITTSSFRKYGNICFIYQSFKTGCNTTLFYSRKYNNIY